MYRLAGEGRLCEHFGGYKTVNRITSHVHRQYTLSLSTFPSADIMGCGILFPRDYNSELDSDGSHDASPDMSDDPLEDYLELDEFSHHTSSESEDEEWWEKPFAENGTKVQVR